MIWKKKDVRIHGGDLRTAFDVWGFRMRGSWDWNLEGAAENLAIGSLRACSRHFGICLEEGMYIKHLSYVASRTKNNEVINLHLNLEYTYVFVLNTYVHVYFVSS